ncbi:hypothetical protein GCM10009665_02730 [Kitasatospora nipponensis]|uniref:Uncharacterized protein n=1 Tax=Kitasatospora nipponensis TaxID=258049 RepID=A0ABP4GBI9_9ACTN
MNATRNTTSKFEQRLAEELALLAAQRYDALPPPRRPLFSRDQVYRHRVPLAVAGVAAVTVAAVVLPTVLGGEDGGAAAYAVTRESDGTFVVALWKAGALPDLVEELRRDGVPVVGLQESPAQAEACHSPLPPQAAYWSSEHRVGDAPGTVRIDPTRIPSGATLLLLSEVFSGPGAPPAAVMTGRIVNSIPDCFGPALMGMSVPEESPTPVDTATPALVSSPAG